jgi:hypothetical protein
MVREGSKDRRERLTAGHSGWSGSSSQDYLYLADLLFGHSKSYAARCPGANCSKYTWAGLPILLAALQALVVEYEVIMNPQRTGEPPTDINRREFVERYGISGDLLDNFNDLIEVRNEVVHPSHAPTGTSDNWPAYLARLKKLGVLESTGAPDHDYLLLSQIASHRLFEWAVGVVRELYQVVIRSDLGRAAFFEPNLSSFASPWFQ